MGVIKNPLNIVTDNLYAYYDVANPISYKGAGTTNDLRSLYSLLEPLSDLKRVNHTSTNPLNYSSDYKGYINFISPVVLNTNNKLFTNSDRTGTCFSWFVRFTSYPTITLSGFNYPTFFLIGNGIAIQSSNNFEFRLGKNGSQITLELESVFFSYFGFQNGNIPLDYAGQHGNDNNTREFIVDITDYFALNEWMMITLNMEYNNVYPNEYDNFWKIYINDTLVGEEPSSWAPIKFINPSNNRNVFNDSYDYVDIATMMSYDTTLSDAQIAQNYNALKHRFNL